MHIRHMYFTGSTVQWIIMYNLAPSKKSHQLLCGELQPKTICSYTSITAAIHSSRFF